MFRSSPSPSVVDTATCALKSLQPHTTHWYALMENMHRRRHRYHTRTANYSWMCACSTSSTTAMHCQSYDYIYRHVFSYSPPVFCAESIGRHSRHARHNCRCCAMSRVSAHTRALCVRASTSKSSIGSSALAINQRPRGRRQQRRRRQQRPCLLQVRTLGRGHWRPCARRWPPCAPGAPFMHCQFPARLSVLQRL